ncbi:uncharacterized protein BXZ73DRAFT_78046 [Epithele typhae]|uniref:uncharacterized protein n=1 Tax=Epithele typhae TaxID=378194 RepID=UPI002007CFEE|nr:uncharacterized protein BXZ73DRAFT_78046 [Epithele typhae]KAH9929941.1 hypothetical protein BXZ73DRAFT_78046 [Epithele typhae]
MYCYVWWGEASSGLGICPSDDVDHSSSCWIRPPATGWECGRPRLCALLQVEQQWPSRPGSLSGAAAEVEDCDPFRYAAIQSAAIAFYVDSFVYTMGTTKMRKEEIALVTRWLNKPEIQNLLRSSQSDRQKMATDMIYTEYVILLKNPLPGETTEVYEARRAKSRNRGLNSEHIRDETEAEAQERKHMAKARIGGRVKEWCRLKIRGVTRTGQRLDEVTRQPSKTAAHATPVPTADAPRAKPAPPTSSMPSAIAPLAHVPRRTDGYRLFMRSDHPSKPDMSKDPCRSTRLRTWNQSVKAAWDALTPEEQGTFALEAKAKDAMADTTEAKEAKRRLATLDLEVKVRAALEAWKAETGYVGAVFLGGLNAYGEIAYMLSRELAEEDAARALVATASEDAACDTDARKPDALAVENSALTATASDDAARGDPTSVGSATLAEAPDGPSSLATRQRKPPAPRPVRKSGVGPTPADEKQASPPPETATRSLVPKLGVIHPMGSKTSKNARAGKTARGGKAQSNRGGKATRVRLLRLAPPPRSRWIQSERGLTRGSGLDTFHPSKDQDGVRIPTRENRMNIGSSCERRSERGSVSVLVREQSLIGVKCVTTIGLTLDPKPLGDSAPRTAATKSFIALLTLTPSSPPSSLHRSASVPSGELGSGPTSAPPSLSVAANGLAEFSLAFWPDAHLVGPSTDAKRSLLTHTHPGMYRTFLLKMEDHFLRALRSLPSEDDSDDDDHAYASNSDAWKLTVYYHLLSDCNPVSRTQWIPWTEDNILIWDLVDISSLMFRGPGEEWRPCNRWTSVTVNHHTFNHVRITMPWASKLRATSIDDASAFPSRHEVLPMDDHIVAKGDIFSAHADHEDEDDERLEGDGGASDGGSQGEGEESRGDNCEENNSHDGWAEEGEGMASVPDVGDTLFTADEDNTADHVDTNEGNGDALFADEDNANDDIVVDKENGDTLFAADEDDNDECDGEDAFAHDEEMEEEAGINGQVEQDNEPSCAPHTAAGHMGATLPRDVQILAPRVLPPELTVSDINYYTGGLASNTTPRNNVEAEAEADGSDTDGGGQRGEVGNTGAEAVGGRGGCERVGRGRGERVGGERRGGARGVGRRGQAKARLARAEEAGRREDAGQAQNGNAEEGDLVAQAWGTRVRRRRTVRWVEKGNAARRARRKWAWRRRARKKARRRRATQRGRARTWARRGRTRRGRGGGRRQRGGDVGWNDAEEGEMKVVGNAAAQMAKGWAEQGQEEEGSEEEGDAKAGGGGGRRGGGERREGRADVLRPVMAWHDGRGHMVNAKTGHSPG